jgi:colanic acid/amylovoran biosynthesis glycosyltransferase
MTQRSENREAFPFEPVYDFGATRSGLGSIFFAFSKYVLGRFPPEPYLHAARSEGVGLLHAHLGWEGARVIQLKRRLRVPLITSFYGRDASMLPRVLYWRVLYGRLFRHGDLFLAEGSAMARTLEKLGCPPERIRVVHLGVDLDKIPFSERRPAADGDLIGLIAASFREKKGIPYALDSVAEVAHRWPRLRLRIIGDGPMRGVIENRVAQPDLKGRVDLLGYVDYSRYLEELKRAHFLLSPSVTASDGDCEGGAPVCLLDAQASGLPILATTHCDIPEATVPDRSALLSPERDLDGLTRNLEHLLAHPENWPEMGRVGRAHVAAEFDIRRQAERMAEIYDEALS